METQNSLQLLVDGTLEALEKAEASDHYRKIFQRVSCQFIRYASEHSIDTFSMDAGIQFLEDHYYMSEKIKNKKWNAIYLRCINALSEYQRTGTVYVNLVSTRKDYVFPVPFKLSADAYISYRKKIGIVAKSIQVSKLYLSRFFSFLEDEGVESLDSITVPMVIKFMESLSASFEKASINQIMRTVRYYLKYCYDQGIMKNNLFPKLPNPHYKRNSSLPSVYSADEVRETLASIDMGNPCGIRNYAMILLIARLGLRSSDVANLRFSNIDWENDKIHLTQVKTGNPLELPLLSDVGEAIINYLKNARPQTDSDHVFVRVKPPYTAFRSSAVGSMVHEQLLKAGIHVEGKKSGSHVLRHSLASRLLEHKIPLPIISEILGHTNTKTTMTYLRIDINELKKCALEVAWE